MAPEITLLNLRTGGQEPATLVDGISERHIRAIQEQWHPVLAGIAAHVRMDYEDSSGFDREGYIEALSRLDLQDAHWNWEQKHEVLARSLAYRTVALECAGHIQAAMIVDVTGRCFLPSQRGQHLVYVDYVAVAPWNRPHLASPRTYKGVGTVMVSAAIALSLKEGFQGRIGLHSLPQAVDFYGGHCGMTTLGPRYEKNGLPYFEMTPDVALGFLNRPEA